MLRKKSVWYVLAILILVANNGRAEVTVQGTVTTADGQAVVGALVRVYRGHKLLQQGNTDGKGSYTIKVADGRPINRVVYSATGYHADVVNDLSGNAQQNINKIVHREGDKLAADVAMQQWMVYEHLYWMDKLSGSPELSVLRERYAKSIRSLPMTDLISEKAAQVLKLYDLSD